MGPRRLPPEGLSPALARKPVGGGSRDRFLATSRGELGNSPVKWGVCEDAFGVVRAFRQGVVLARFRDSDRVEAVRVVPGEELAALAALRARGGVEYAELDVQLTRQYAPNDPMLGQQWHHGTIRSAGAWAVSLATHKVTVAIVDTPFQMNHPDLAPNAVTGWSMVTRSPISGVTDGLYHSTIGAGLAAAVINNGTGVSGVANCFLMPIDIGDTPTASDMHDAIVWAADHGVRVVNVSWDGAFSSVINDAGGYLRQKTGGMLFMSGVNGQRFLNYPNQPYIYAVAMTDRDDLPRSSYGPHIDFAAPGWQIYSTTTNSTYEVDSGSSYSSPLLAGIAAWIMSVNPDLGPDEIEGILQASSVDLGDPGWDQHYGWGRIDFSQAAEKTFATLPVSRIAAERASTVTIVAVRVAGATYRLARQLDFGAPWETVGDVISEATDATVKLVDPAPPHGQAFYRVEITLPHETP